VEDWVEAWVHIEEIPVVGPEMDLAQVDTLQTMAAFQLVVVALHLILMEHYQHVLVLSL
jgi:hypothetical protein